MCQISLYSTSLKKRLLDLKDPKGISNGKLQYSTVINKSFRQKATKEPQLNVTIDKTDLIDTCRVFQPTATQYTFFPAVYGRCGMMNIFLFFVCSSPLCVCVCVCVFMLMCTYFFFAFWTQGFMLARQAVYRLNCIYSPFCSGYFGDRVSCFAQASFKHDPLILGFQHCWNKRHAWPRLVWNPNPPK
jgi:hypothetical protein